MHACRSTLEDPTKSVESHREDFLQNAFAVVGAKHALAGRLVAKLPANPKKGAVLVNLAALHAAAKDSTKMLGVMEHALEMGVLPAQMEREAALETALEAPKAKALLDRYRVSAKKKPAAKKKSGGSVDASFAKLIDCYAKHRAKAASDRERKIYDVALGSPATAKDVAAAEKATKATLPDDYKELLGRHDGAKFGIDAFVLLGTKDLAGGTPLAKSAKGFIQDSADYGSPELLECVPVANVGGPNNWLLYDPRNTNYLYCLNADHFEIAGLAAALERRLKIDAE